MSNIHTPTDQIATRCLDAGTLSTSASQPVDCLGYTRAKLVVAATTGAASTLDCGLQESNDNGATDPYSAVPSGAIATITANSSHVTRTISVNLHRRKRYLRAQETIAGTVAGAITIELYNAALMPVVQDTTPVVI